MALVLKETLCMLLFMKAVMPQEDFGRGKKEAEAVVAEEAAEALLLAAAH